MVGCVWWFTVRGVEGSLAGLGVGLFQGGRPVAVGAKVSMWGACWLAAPQGAARSVRRTAHVFTSIRQCVQFWGGCVQFLEECVQFSGRCVQFWVEVSSLGVEVSSLGVEVFTLPDDALAWGDAERAGNGV